MRATAETSQTGHPGGRHDDGIDAGTVLPGALAFDEETAPRRWRGLAVALAGVVIVVIAWLAGVWSRNADIEALHRGSARRLDTLTAALFAPTDKFSYMPGMVARYGKIVQALETPQNPARITGANELLYEINAAAKSAVVYVLDRNGLVIASSNWQQPESFVGQNYAFRPYFQDALRGGEGRFYAMGTTSLLPGYYFSSPVTRGDAIIGVAVVKIDMSNFDRAWNGRDSVVVSDHNGVIFLSTQDDWKYRPMQSLSDAALQELKRTRQYENVLKPPLRTTPVEEYGPDERMLRIAATDEAAGGDTEYFVRSGKLPGSSWTVSVLTPVADIDARAHRSALFGAAGGVFLLVLALYVLQVRANLREREASRQALERAHGALAQQHRRLQTVSEELRVTSATDPLTGAYNRRYFFEAADKMLAAQRRTDGALAVMMIDVDHFKEINDVYGHPAGDRVLQTMTAIARDVLRDTDLFARFGGEEFIVALPNTSVAEAAAVAERLRQRVAAQPFAFQGHSIDVRVSCGVAMHGAENASIEDTIKRADVALYRAKSLGRNRVESA